MLQHLAVAERPEEAINMTGPFVVLVLQLLCEIDHYYSPRACSTCHMTVISTVSVVCMTDPAFLVPSLYPAMSTCTQSPCSDRWHVAAVQILYLRDAVQP